MGRSLRGAVRKKDKEGRYKETQGGATKGAVPRDAQNYLGRGEGMPHTRPFSGGHVLLHALHVGDGHARSLHRNSSSRVVSRYI